MKHLIIMRHAKAEKDAASGEDFDRRLMPRGREDATHVAQGLKAYGLKPDLALVSASARTQETFAQVEAVLGAVTAQVSKDLYNAGPDTLRRAIEAQEDACDCMLVVAHNPGVQLLVADYLFEGAASAEVIDRVRGGYPTAAATVFTVDAAGRPLYDGLYLAK